MIFERRRLLESGENGGLVVMQSHFGGVGGGEINEWQAAAAMVIERLRQRVGGGLPRRARRKHAEECYRNGAQSAGQAPASDLQVVFDPALDGRAALVGGIETDAHQGFALL